MAVFNLKNWRLERGTYVSPRFGEAMEFNNCKRFLIRSRIHADYDDKNRIIKIPVDSGRGDGNLEQLKKLKML